MKTKGIAFDATGQKIGTATKRTDGIDVRLCVLRSEVREPVRIVWDVFDTGLANYPAIVIAGRA